MGLLLQITHEHHGDPGAVGVDGIGISTAIQAVLTPAAVEEASGWTDAVDNGDGHYEAVIPAGNTSIIFCRMNPATAENNWDNKWNQASDLTIPTDGTSCYTVAEGTWDNAWGDDGNNNLLTLTEASTVTILFNADTKVITVSIQAPKPPRAGPPPPPPVSGAATTTTPPTSIF